MILYASRVVSPKVSRKARTRGFRGRKKDEKKKKEKQRQFTHDQRETRSISYQNHGIVYSHYFC